MEAREKMVLGARDPASILKRISELDLEPIMVKLMDPTEGEGWSLEHVQAVEKWYRRFLYLNAIYPAKSIVPTKDIDKFWHCHILDTRKYAEDSNSVFGYFLHHFPYFGMRGEEDHKNLLAASGETWELFRKHFAEEPQVSDEKLSMSVCGNVNCYGNGCTGSKCGNCCDGDNCNPTRPQLTESFIN